MDLRKFIAETLCQIVSGVEDARRDIGSMGTNAAINPTTHQSSSTKRYAAASPVEFDVAITVSDRSDAMVEAGEARETGVIEVVRSLSTVNSSSAIGASREDATVSRLKFSVMLAQPSDEHVLREPRISSMNRHGTVA